MIRVEWRRNGLRLLLATCLCLCAIQASARLNDDWIDAGNGSVSNGVFTASNSKIGAVLTIDNASHIYSSSGFYELKLRNQNATTTITFRFEDKNISIKKFWYNAYKMKTKKVLWSTVSYSSSENLSCGSDNNDNGGGFTKTENSDGSVTYTCTGQIDHIFLNAVYIYYDPTDEIKDNPPIGVSKQYTGSNQILFKGTDESKYSYNTYVNSSYKLKYGGSVYLWFSGAASDKGLAKDKGTYSMGWWYDIGSYGSYSFSSFSISGGGLGYIKTNGNNGSSSSPLGTFTSEIYGLQMTDVVAPTAKDLIYTGESQTLVTAASSPQGKGMYWIPGEAGFDDAIPTRTDAGTYRVYWYIESTQNAYDNYGGPGETTRKGPIEVTIQKVAIPAYTAPVALTKVFNATEQPLVNVGTATGGTLRYRLGTEGTWTDEVPTAMAVGDYNIYWYVKGDNNHLDMGSEGEPYGPLTAHIIAASYDMNGVNWQGSSTVTYDGTDHQSQLTIQSSSLPSGVGIASYILKNSSDTEVTEAIDAGTYTITANLTSTNPNYAAPAPVSTTLTIQPFNLQGAYSSASPIADQTYSGAAIEPVTASSPVVLKIGMEGITIPVAAYSVTYTNNINAGTKTATATLYANGSDANYVGSTAVKFTILKKVVQVTTQDQTIEYGSALSSSADKASLVNAVDGHVVSSVKLTADNALGIGTHTHAIVASDVFIKDGSDNDVTGNYTINTNIVENRGTLTITSKAGTGFTVSGLKEEYEGDGLTAVVPDGDIAVYDGTTKLTKGTDYTVAYTDNTLAGTATATFTFQGNYTGSIAKDFIIYYTTKTYNRTGYSYNYCTYCHPTMTLKAGTGAEVFYCQLANSNTEVQLTKETSNVVTAATPVMLRTPSTTDVVKLYATTESAAVSVANNALTGVGTTGAKAAGADIVPDDKTYIFDGDNFVWATGGTYTAYRAYIDGSSWATSSARLKVAFGSGNTTGISSIDADNNQDDRWYDLQGNRINKPTRKGLYIRNGLKVVVK